VSVGGDIVQFGGLRVILVMRSVVIACRHIKASSCDLTWHGLPL
jgi:hypothetical protein